MQDENSTEQEIVTLVNNVSDFVAANQKVFTIVLAVAAVTDPCLCAVCPLSGPWTNRRQARSFPLPMTSTPCRQARPRITSRALGLFREVHKKYPSSRSGSLAHYYMREHSDGYGAGWTRLSRSTRRFTTEQAGDKFLLGLVYGRMGYLYRALGKQQDAIQAFERPNP